MHVSSSFDMHVSSSFDMHVSSSFDMHVSSSSSRALLLAYSSSSLSPKSTCLPCVCVCARAVCVCRERERERERETICLRLKAGTIASAYTAASTSRGRTQKPLHQCLTLGAHSIC
jgi:hypothetical protein